MRKLIFLFFAYCCCLSCESNNTSVAPQQIFSIVDYLDKYEKNSSDINKAMMVTISQGESDTIVYEKYAIDSIRHILMQFEFSDRERAGEFDIDTEKSQDVSCIKYTPKKELDILYLNTCQNKNGIISFSGEKYKKSLLNIFYQRFHFEPDGGFELNSTFVDKVQSDTLKTTNYLTWKNK